MPYRPDDAQLTPAALDFLRTPEGLHLRHAIANLPDPGNPTVAQIATLRKSFPPAPLHAALVLGKIQTKARPKFPHIPYVWATPEALEQSTHHDVARYKATRMAQLGATHVLDLCAGIGGDTLAFAEILPVTAIELSPIRAHCLRLNALDSTTPLHPIDIQVADITTLIPDLPREAGTAGAWFHIDPARRSAGRRSPRYQDLIPGPDLLAQLISRPAAQGILKLSPAVDFDSLPTGHLELISHLDTVVQALLYVGTALPPNQRTATILSREAPFHLTAVPQPTEFSPTPTGSFAPPLTLYEVDGAITRAGLAQHLARTHHLISLTSDGGYLLSHPGTQISRSAAGNPAPLTPSNASTPPSTAMIPFLIHTIVPFSRIPEALTTLPPSPPGPVEVKCRGHLPGIDTDDLQHRWTQLRSPRGTCTILLFRQHDQTLAALGFRTKSYS